VQQGSGTTMITNEVTLTSASSFEGVTKVKQGTLWVNGSAAKLTQSGATIEVGELSGDTGTFVVWNGAAVSDSRGYIGLRSGSQGTAIIHGAGSVWQSSASLAVGYEGSGNLWIRQDALVTSNEGYVGFAAGAFGDVVVESGGEWRTNGVLGFQVGRSGEGHLTLTTGGKMTVANGSGALTLATNSGSKGTLSFGSSDSLNPTTAGTLNASSIEGGNGETAINFYQTDTVTLSMPISIGGTIKQQGSGTTVLNGEVFAGPVTVSAGTLLIGGTLTSEDVTVKNGGTIGGAGSIYFTVNLESGARLAPGNSIGTLSVSELNWNSGATLAFELGAGTSDQIMLDLFTKVGTGAYTFQFLNAGWQIGQTYSLATFGSTNFNAGDFNFSNTGGFDGTFVINGNQLQFTLTAVPEPSTLGFAAIAGAGTLIFVSVRRRKAV
jgi:T5SS/PEP-CTERM-associated repeat protein/autotransporter-associated beta strand protein